MAASIGAAAIALPGCPDDDGTGGTGGSGGEGGGGAAEPAWRVVFDEGELDRALLSVWGTSSTSVYAVGGPLGNSGFDALALHYDGETWTDLAPGGSDSFWWVHGTGDDDVWMVGENGRVTHFDGETFEEHDVPTTATLWGAIAFAKDDVWVVGGMVGGPATEPDDVVLHYDGSAWSLVPLPGEPLGRALFKVWGTSGDDLFVVGEGGVMWHKKGAEWLLESDPPIAGGNLTTVHGCSSSDVYAVGGRDLLHYDGSTWTKLEQGLSNDVNGVVCVGDGEAAIVGMGGLKQRMVDGAWDDDFIDDPHGNLHAVWSDETGAYWAVGGDFVASPKPDVARNGIVARYGPGNVSDSIE
ncbi:MAG: hypothetical protein HOW73_47440 [Polyangiaceae bacterium]|nr:hypothetical protein [Polyangiaceae bacterium]